MTAQLVCAWRLACGHLRPCSRTDHAYLLDAWARGMAPTTTPRRCPSCHRAAPVLGVEVRALDILPGSS